MSGRVLLLVSIIFAFLQGTILPLVFAEGLLAVLYLVTRSQRVGGSLLVSGLAFDLIQNQRLGVTSLIFLTTLALALILKNNLILQRAIVLSLFAVAISAVRSRILFGYIEPFPLILLFGICYLVFNLMWRPDMSGKIKI